MMKFIANIFKFTLFLGIVYCTLVISWEYSFADSSFKKNINYKKGAYGHLFSRLKDVKNKKNIDILILGASHAYRGIDTRIFDKEGIQSFNLGSSNQTHFQTNYLLKRYLDSLNPKYVIYETYPYSLETDGVESTIDLISNETIDWNAFLFVLQMNNIKIYNTFIVSLFEQWVGLKKDFHEDIIKNDDTYIKNGGFVEKKMRTFKGKKQELKKWKTSSSQLEKFKENLNLLSKYDIPVLLIQAPTTSFEYNSYSNNSTLDSLYQTLGVYYNFNKISKLSDQKHFYDLEHLNQTGVEIFNKDLLLLMKRINFIPSTSQIQSPS